MKLGSQVCPDFTFAVGIGRLANFFQHIFQLRPVMAVHPRINGCGGGCHGFKCAGDFIAVADIFRCEDSDTAPGTGMHHDKAVVFKLKHRLTHGRPADAAFFRNAEFADPIAAAQPSIANAIFYQADNLFAVALLFERCLFHEDRLEWSYNCRACGCGLVISPYTALSRRRAEG